MKRTYFTTLLLFVFSTTMFSGCWILYGDDEPDDGPVTKNDDDDDDNNDDNDEVIPPGPDSCSIEFVKWAISNDTVSKSYDDADGSYNAADIAANCSASKNAAEQCGGAYSELMIGTLDFLEQINGLLGLVGGLKSGGFSGQQAGALIAGFVDPMIYALDVMDEKAGAVEALDSCEIAFEGGLPFAIEGMIEATTTAKWGLAEAHALGGVADLINAALNFLMAHDLDLPIDKIMAIGDFKPVNLPHGLKIAIEPLLTGNTVLSIADVAQFNLVRPLINDAVDELLPLIDDGAGGGLLYGRSGYVIDYDDKDGNTKISAGDVITINGTVTMDDGTTEEGAEYEIPADVTAEKVDASLAMLDQVSESLNTPATCDAADEASLPAACLSIEDVNALLSILEALDSGLPPIIRINLANYFEAPATAGIRNILSNEGVIVVAGEIVDCANSGIANCDHPAAAITEGDAGHFDNAVGIPADGIGPVALGDLDNTGAAHKAYVLPYIELGSCDINGAVWSNLSGFAGQTAFTSIWDADYSLMADGATPEPDAWAHGAADSGCHYNFNKLLALAVKESGLLEPPDGN